MWDGAGMLESHAWVCWVPVLRDGTSMLESHAWVWWHKLAGRGAYPASFGLKDHLSKSLFLFRGERYWRHL